ncbi:MAG: hypothetical protein ACOC8B_00855 [Gemmatimonadota bacterium]
MPPRRIRRTTTTHTTPPAASPAAPLAAALLAAAVLAGCGAAGDASPLAGEWTAERDTVGDTVVVRTVSGSVWGREARLVPGLTIGVLEGEPEYMLGNVRSLAVAPDGSIYLFDGHVPALRKYSSEGEYVATFGREGGGPGEYESPDGGLAVLPDGRVLLRDPGNARINVYSPDGEPLDGWPIRGGFTTSRPLFVDTAGNAYTQALLDPEADIRDWRMGLIRYGPDGTTGDTLPAPTWDYEEARIIAQRETGTSMSSVPFSPTDTWTFSPFGYFVGGVSTRYAIDLFRSDSPVLRIERAAEPVPVDPDEKADARRRRTASMRGTDPNWRWNGPSIPDVKPPFRSVLAGRRGRIWVRVPQPGERIEDVDDPGADETQPGEVPEPRWREPLAFDVFEADGRYLGRVHAPDDLAFSPMPVIDGDRVWAVVRDELDVQYVARFRIGEPAAGGS